MELFLRIAPELYLKRLVVGGFERVFEIARVFRNEGLSTRHNPEFTMLELYQAYGDYHDVMALTEELVAHLAQELHGTTVLTYGGRELDLTPPWRRASLTDLVEEHAGVRVDVRMPIDELRRIAAEHGVEVKDGYGPGKLVLEIYEKTTEAELWGPVFVIDYPKEVSPLARDHRELPDMVERFEGIVAGRELVQRVLRARRPRRAAGPLRGPGPPEGGRRRRGDGRRRGLPPRPRVRPAAHRRPRHRHRPPRDAAHRHARRSATSSCSPRCAPSRSSPWTGPVARVLAALAPAACSPSTRGAGTRSARSSGWSISVLGAGRRRAGAARRRPRVPRPLGAWRSAALPGLAGAWPPPLGVDPLYAWIGTPERHLGCPDLGALRAAARGRARTLDAERDAPRAGRRACVVAGLGVGAVATAEALGWEPAVLDVADRLSGHVRLAGLPRRRHRPAAARSRSAWPLDRRIADRWRRAGGGRGRRSSWSPASGPGPGPRGSGSRSRRVVAVVAAAARAALAASAPGRAAAAIARGRARRRGRRPRGAHAGRGPAVDAHRPRRAPVAAAASTSGGWRRTWSRDHPLIGVGPEGYRIAFARGRRRALRARPRPRASSPTARTPAPLDLALAGGLPPWLAWVGGASRSSAARRWRALRARAPRGCAGSRPALVAHLVGQLLLFPVAELEPVAWLLAGLVVADPPPARDPCGRTPHVAPGRRSGGSGSAALVARRRSSPGSPTSWPTAGPSGPPTRWRGATTGRAADAADVGGGPAPGHRPPPPAGRPGRAWPTSRVPLAGLQRAWTTPSTCRRGDPIVLLDRLALLVERAEATQTAGPPRARPAPRSRRLLGDDPYNAALWRLAARLAALAGDGRGGRAGDRPGRRPHPAGASVR